MSDRLKKRGIGTIGRRVTHPAHMPPTIRRLHLLFYVSGVAGLAYQVVWTRMLTTGLGHEAPSILAIVAGFFAGLGIGALTSDRAVSLSPKPGAWYAGLELMIG